MEKGTVEFGGGDAESPHSIFLNLGLYDYVIELAKQMGVGLAKTLVWVFQSHLMGKPQPVFWPTQYLFENQKHLCQLFPRHSCYQLVTYIFTELLTFSDPACVPFFWAVVGVGGGQFPDGPGAWMDA